MEEEAQASADLPSMSLKTQPSSEFTRERHGEVSDNFRLISTDEFNSQVPIFQNVVSEM